MPAALADETDVLYRFHLEQETPDAALLIAYVRRYPQHREALVAHAVLAALEADEWTDPPVPEMSPADSDAVEAAMAVFHSRLREQRGRRRAYAQITPDMPDALCFACPSCSVGIGEPCIKREGQHDTRTDRARRMADKVPGRRRDFAPFASDPTHKK